MQQGGILKPCSRETGQGSVAEEMLPVIYDMELYTWRRYTGESGDKLLKSSVNFYRRRHNQG